MIFEAITNTLEFSSILLFYSLIALNILIVKLYRENRFFPVIFLIFDLVFGMSIITENELLITILLLFTTIFNLFLINYQREIYGR